MFDVLLDIFLSRGEIDGENLEASTEISEIVARNKVHTVYFSYCDMSRNNNGRIVIDP